MAQESRAELINLAVVPAPNSPQPTETPELIRSSPGELLWALWRRKWVIAALVLTSLLAAFAWLAREPRVYRASCSLEISPNAPRYLGPGVQDVGESGPIAYWQTKEFFETQYQIIRSRSVASRVVNKLGLDADADFLGIADRSPEKQRELAGKIDAAGVLQRAIRVEPVKDSRIVRISVEDRNPERAQRLADAVAESYINQNLERRLDTTHAASVWLADQLGGLKEQLETSELRLHDFKRENDILTASFEDRQNISSQRLLALNEALTQIRIREAEQYARLKAVQKAQRDSAQGQPDALHSLHSIAESKTLAALELRLREREDELAAISQRYLERHPTRIALEEQVAGARAQLNQELARLVRREANAHQELADTSRQLSALIEGAKAEAFELNRKAVDYKRLEREQESNARLYDLVLQRLKEAELSALLRTNNAQVLDAARTPKLPIRPRRKVVLLAALLFGLLGGTGLALLLERLDDTIKTQEDVEHGLGLPFLGIVPSVDEAPSARASKSRKGAEPEGPKAERDLHVHLRPQSRAAECVRSIRTSLLLSSPDQPFTRLLVTSAAPQEGKTTVAISLAVAMASAGSRTLLVDTDMRRPRVHRSFGLGDDRGLSSLIAGAASLDEVVAKSEVPGLFVLPCGPLPPNPAELLHSERFSEVVNELGNRFDRIIFDSPPVAAVTDALVLSKHVDGVVMVVKAGQTQRDLARRTGRALREVNAKIFGVVVNDVDLQKAVEGYYYYQQKYGYAAEGEEA